VKPQSTARIPKAGTTILVLSLIALVLVAGHSKTGPPAAAAQAQLVWVRQDPPVINSRNDPTFWECPEGVHCEGSFWDYIVDETDIFKEERYVNNGIEYYHITLESDFDRPPLVMKPGSRYQVRANFSHSTVSGTPTYAECLYFQYHEESRPWLADPPREYEYCPWHEDFDGTASATWMLDPGWPFKEGDTFQLRADWIYDDPANVTWTYRAEQDSPVEEARLGAEVVTPVVTHQGEEVPPGEMFFPETCPLPFGRSAANCNNKIAFTEMGMVDLYCVNELEDRLINLLSLVNILSDENEDIRLKMALFAMTEARIDRMCRYLGRAPGDFSLGLALEEGGLLLTNAMADQKVEVATPLATAITTLPGAFVAGYDPESGSALFQSYSTSLMVQPNTGAPLNLQPRQQVAITALGVGPVSDLPHLFLPLQIR
jgi:hypothetical protein